MLALVLALKAKFYFMVIDVSLKNILVQNPHNLCARMEIVWRMDLFVMVIKIAPMVQMRQILFVVSNVFVYTPHKQWSNTYAHAPEKNMKSIYILFCDHTLLYMNNS